MPPKKIIFIRLPFSGNFRGKLVQRNLWIMIDKTLQAANQRILYSSTSLIRWKIYSMHINSFHVHISVQSPARQVALVEQSDVSASEPRNTTQCDLAKPRWKALRFQFSLIELKQIIMLIIKIHLKLYFIEALNQLKCTHWQAQWQSL